LKSKKNNLNNFCIGTAQFGMSYGIYNHKIKLREIKKILKISRKFGLNQIDTSMLYGDSEAILGKAGIKNWKIVTKLPPVPKKEVDLKKWIYNKTRNSIKKLKIKNLYGLILHDSEALLGSRKKEIYEALSYLKKKKYIAKIGVSIYNFNVLKKILKFYNLDIVQLPFNIIDQRLIKTGIYKELKRKKIEVQARSIFLKGLLLAPTSYQKRKFSKWNNLWNDLHFWKLNNNYDLKDICISFVSNFRYVKKIILGVDSVQQLNQILKFKRYKNFSLPKSFYIKNEKLINPSNWTQLNK